MQDARELEQDARHSEGETAECLASPLLSRVQDVRRFRGLGAGCSANMRLTLRPMPWAGGPDGGAHIR